MIIKILKTISTVLVAVFLIFALLLVGVRVFGLQVYTVLSGSMEPVYRTGSLIYVKEVDTAELKVGDDITYKLTGSTIATHRIIEVVKDGNDLKFRTQGVANKKPDDELVHSRSVIGVPVFTIPFIGYIANFIQAPPGMYLAIAVGAILILIVAITELLTIDDKKTNEV